MPLGKPPHCLDYTLKIKILLSSLLIRPLVTQPLSPKTREGDGFVRKLPFGVRAPTLRATGSKHLPKNYLQGGGLTQKISLQSINQTFGHVPKHIFLY